MTLLCPSILEMLSIEIPSPNVTIVENECLEEWDGHQFLNSGMIDELSYSITPKHSIFIKGSRSYNGNWRWGGGVNDC